MKNAALMVLAVVVIVGGVIGFALLNDKDNEQVDTSTEQTTDSELPVNNSSGAAGTALSGSPEAENNDTDFSNGEQDQNVFIEASNYEFSITEITANRGDTVTVEMTSTEGMHDFVIDEFDVQSEVVNSGGSTLVTFTIPEDASGSFEYYCSIGNHRDLGMVGTLTVN